jgi:hypothetical protein
MREAKIESTESYFQSVSCKELLVKDQGEPTPMRRERREGVYSLPVTDNG